MRISWSECLAWHGLWLLPQGTGRSLGKEDLLLCRRDMGRMEVPHTTAGQPQAPALTGTMRSQGSQIPASASAKAQWLFQAGNKRRFPLLEREDLSKQDLGLPSSEGKAEAVGRSSVMSSAVLTHCSRQFSPTAVLFRPASLKIAFNYCCCHSDQVLLCLYLLIPLCVPALNPAFAFRSAVLHRDDSKEYEEKATTCHLVHLPAQWWLRSEWKIFFFSLSTSF